MSAAEAEVFVAEGEARTPAAHKGGVYFLAEPTGVEQLLGLLDRLVDSGKSVIVIEHLAARPAGNPGARGHR